MNESAFWLGFIIVCLILIVLFIIKYGIPTGTSIRLNLTSAQIKNYFIIKHSCKVCNTRLKRISHKVYKGKGWSKSLNEPGEYHYGEKYEMTFDLKCPNCNRTYTLDDLK